MHELKEFVTRRKRRYNPSVTFGDSSLYTREPYTRRSSADSGFGLLPDGAWTSTRYACPRDASVGKTEKDSIQGLLVFETTN